MLKTFKIGGIHPAENKLSAGSGIKEIQLPETVTILTNQHIGAPSKLIVAKGDLVKTGQLIAKYSGFVSANIHSSISGKVVKIEPVYDSTGYKREAVTIESDGQDIWDDSIDRSETLVTDNHFTANQIEDRILSCGIVGMGGATFPTHVKLLHPPGDKAELLLINGAECEPYLTADHRLMIEKGEEILVGVKMLMKTLGVEKAIIGIELNKPDAIKNMTTLSQKYSGISICPLKVKYPQGGEKQLIKAVTGREVPSGKLPISIGVVVNNIATSFAIYEAVVKNKPLFERVISVTGKKLKSPSNFKVRIGTSVTKLIEEAGGIPEGTSKIIMGGPMMGRSITTTEIPVTKGTSGILLLDESEAHRKEYLNCIRCGRCIGACPMGLEPYLLMNLSEKNVFDIAENNKIMDCIECGSCNFVCPSNRPILDYIRFGKAKVGNIMRNRKK